LDQQGRGEIVIPNTKSSAEFELPPQTYQPSNCLRVTPPVQGSILKLRFLVQYHAMFNNMALEHPIPFGDVLEWIVEHYSMTVKENISYNQVYEEISANWQVYPPLAVFTNGHFCQCEQWHKWNPRATIDSIEYNWLVIPGQFSTLGECAESYVMFHNRHIYYTNLVCFRAVVFYDFLANMCYNYQILINVNHFDPNRPEFHIMLKIKF